MGHYDDDGVYHKDAYDDDHLDLQDIGKFCEKKFSWVYKDPFSRYTRSSRHRKEYYDKMPPKESRMYQEAQFSPSSCIGMVIGAVIGFFITRAVGTVLLIVSAAGIGSGIGGVFHRRVVEEVYLSPREMMQFFCMQYGTRLSVCLLCMDIILYVCK